MHFIYHIVNNNVDKRSESEGLQTSGKATTQVFIIFLGRKGGGRQSALLI